MIKAGHQLIIPCRDIDRREFVLRSFARDQINISEVEELVSLPILDLGDLNNIEKFANEFVSNNSRIDTIILNAGLQYTGDKQIRRSSQGIELTFAVNHLSHQYLIQALLDILLKSDFPRVVITSSEVHNPDSPGGKIGESASLGNLEGIKASRYFKMIDGSYTFSADKTYKDSKLCNILFAKELNRRLTLRNLSMPVICWAPGLVIPRTQEGFFRYSRKNNELGQRLFALFARDIFRITESPERAGEILKNLAISDRYLTNGFNYYSNKIQGFSRMKFENTNVSEEANEEIKAKELWELSNKIILNSVNLNTI
ncbi:Light-dependent protochlorophyllide reductase [Prochlorococcus marinus str. SS51]|nr:Light-dependent protochlorophyllide reductase [Prochlorococcus marinus str. SS2]KGG32070.1 Light-dependent protochlorophyllide reductase [Prochlorococcus marinus str. SS51]